MMLVITSCECERDTGAAGTIEQTETKQIKQGAAGAGARSNSSSRASWAAEAACPGGKNASNRGQGWRTHAQTTGSWVHSLTGLACGHAALAHSLLEHEQAGCSWGRVGLPAPQSRPATVVYTASTSSTASSRSSRASLPSNWSSSTSCGHAARRQRAKRNVRARVRRASLKRGSSAVAPGSTPSCAAHRHKRRLPRLAVLCRRHHLPSASQLGWQRAIHCPWPRPPAAPAAHRPGQRPRAAS